jgi:DNA polymerase-1
MSTGLSLDSVFSLEPAAKVANLLTSEAGTEKISKLAELARPFHCGPEKPGNPEQSDYAPAKVANLLIGGHEIHENHPAKVAKPANPTFEPEKISKLAGLARVLPPELEAAALAVCDLNGDDEAGKQAILDDLAASPAESWPALLDHFTRQLPPPPEPGRVRVRFPDFGLTDGSRIAFDADIPASRLPALLASGHTVECPDRPTDPPDVAVVNMAYIPALHETVEYIGRPNPSAGLAGSPLANPFKLTNPADEAERSRVIGQYREWFTQTTARPDSPESRELARLRTLATAGPLKLRCYCHPKPCHGDVIAAAITGTEPEPPALTLTGQATITAEDTAGALLRNLNTTVHYIRDTDPARDAVARLLEAGRPLLGLDIETGGLDPLTDRTRCLQVADDTAAYVFDFDGVDPAALWPLMNAGGMFVAHNATFEWRFLRRVLLHPATTLHDSMLMMRTAYGLQAGGGYPSLADTAARILGLTIDKTVRRSDWLAAGPLTPAQVHYAALDAVLAYRLAHPLRDRLRETGQTKAYGLMTAALPTVAGHMLAGVPFDVEAHRRLMADWQAAAMAARDHLDRIMPGVNPDSPDQLAAWLMRSIPPDLLAAWPKTTGGKLATDADALAGWPDAPPELRTYKEHGKLLSTYGAKFAAHVHPDTGRIHASYNIAGTRGGRFNCSKPNLQNPPRLAAFRRLFRPGHELYRLIVADYSQIELRIAALMARDETMLQAYRDGVDLHRLTASITAGIPLAEVTKAQRQAAKAINFGLIYGMQPPGLRAYAKATYGVDMSAQAAQNAHTAFFQHYQGIHRWHAETKARGVYDKTVRTAAGLVRDMGNEPGGWKLTNALNTPVQGSGAEVLLSALAKLPAALSGLDCRVVHHVHDEIILECAETDIEAGKAALQSAMTAAFDELFPGSGMTTASDLVEAHDGRTWEDAKG